MHRIPVSIPRTCRRALAFGALVVAGLAAVPAHAAPFSFSTGSPDGKIATVSRPGVTGRSEVESADDFVLAQTTSIDHASFVGLLPQRAALSSVVQVRIEIYRVFPLDSTLPADGRVPTRVNSPSDDAFAVRDSSASSLSFATTLLSATFTTQNSVSGNGIHPSPNQFTGGEGPVIGEEVRFDVAFATPLLLAADHYFFVPQVLLSSGDFYWLSAPKPIVPPGDPFNPDLQSWIRDDALAPDWLRIGTDITGQGPFNAVFSLSGQVVGQVVPEPAPWLLLAIGASAASLLARLRSRRRASR